MPHTEGTPDRIVHSDANGGGGTSTRIVDSAGNELDVQPDGSINVNVAGGGGPVSIADGADVNAGSTTDAAETSDSDGTLSGKLRGLVKWAYERMPTSLGQKLMAASFPVTLASDQSAVPISAASLPLPTGAATAANQQTDALTDTQLRASAVPVSGTVGVNNFPATQPVSATNFDIRDLLFASDKVDASGSSVSVSNFPATQPVSGTVEVTNDVGNPLPVNGTVSANLNAGTNNIGDVDVETFELSAEHTFQNAATANGNGTAMAVSGYSTVLVELPATADAAILPEGSRDGGTTWYQINAERLDTVAASYSASFSAAGVYVVQVTGLTHVRMRIASYGSGSITVKGYASPQSVGPRSVVIGQSLPFGLNLIGVVAVQSLPSGTLANGAETAVTGTAASILSSNVNRKHAIIQNVGTANIRVGITGVTATTGMRLVPGAIATLPVTSAIFAIREGSTSSTALAQEIT